MDKNIKHEFIARTVSCRVNSLRNKRQNILNEIKRLVLPFLDEVEKESGKWLKDSRPSIPDKNVSDRLKKLDESLLELEKLIQKIQIKRISMSEISKESTLSFLKKATENLLTNLDNETMAHIATYHGDTLEADTNLFMSQFVKKDKTVVYCPKVDVEKILIEKEVKNRRTGRIELVKSYDFVSRPIKSSSSSNKENDEKTLFDIKT